MVHMKPRRAQIERKTAETDIRLRLNLDGQGRYAVSTGIRFLDHMLELFSRHGGFDLDLEAKGDLDVDQHHTVEDIGVALGEAGGTIMDSGDACRAAGDDGPPSPVAPAVGSIPRSPTVAAA